MRLEPKLHIMFELKATMNVDDAPSVSRQTCIRR